MSTKEKKAERIKITNRPFVQYTDSKFMHTLGTVPEISHIHDWLCNHKNANIAFLFILIVLLVASLFDGPVSILAFIILWFAGVASVVESGRSQRRSVAFYTDLIKRGGIVINPWNKAFLHASPVISIVFLAICCASAGFFVWYKVTGAEVQLFTTGYITFYMSIQLTIDTYTILANYACPTIFLDIDEGALFGGAIFPYKVLSGLSYNGRNDNTFKLTYEGKEVATGKILPEDWAYLHSMIEVSEKYKDYLVDDDLPASSLATNAAR
jgi:hypothetical protein